MFFAPAFRPESEIVIWGPAAPDAPLEDRIARYISAPLSPVEVRELPCHVSFRDCPDVAWEIGSAQIRAASVTHRGPTLGYRITEGDTSLCYIPDHEPGLGTSLASSSPSGYRASSWPRNATLLIHDCQYTDAEYPEHAGWGHSSVSDALEFASRVSAERVLLFHHDPLHADDLLDALHGAALSCWDGLVAIPKRSRWRRSNGS